MENMSKTAEHQRLEDYRERRSNPKHWGTYLSERAWGTVREDYSASGDIWQYLPHDHARSKAYRWNEDGLAGICDRHQNLCFAPTLWNGRDPILKERLFGLSGPEGNHGEDVKECYFYLDATPTHSYMKMLYKYPQAAFPYQELVRENGQRGYDDPEYELWDTGIFDDGRYFDVLVEYAKVQQDDILIRLSISNRGPDPARCLVLPTLWFRNTWSWGYEKGPLREVSEKPRLTALNDTAVRAEHVKLGIYHCYAEGTTHWIFTENETNSARLYGAQNESAYVKDAFHRYIIKGETDAVNPERYGTKAAAIYDDEIAPNETRIIRLRLCEGERAEPFEGFKDTFTQRIIEADAFYEAVQGDDLNKEERHIQRKALAGMLWTKQLYYYDVRQWLEGDPGMPPPPEGRGDIRNGNWEHLTNFDIISMPDKWEFPWYASWDLAFHCITLAMVDPDFAKRQLELITREWYMDPDGKFPAYEGKFSHVTPPVQAWATWHVCRLDWEYTEQMDRDFLEGMFHKLLLNFTWWVNQTDVEGHSIFQGGFLGLDNISFFDRSEKLPTGGQMYQADATAWMGFYCLSMLNIAMRLARQNPVYEDTASKFFEHYLRIAKAMSSYGEEGLSLWDEADGFFYDMLHLRDGTTIPLKVRSLVGLMALIGVEPISQESLKALPTFHRRMKWFLEHRPDLSSNLNTIEVSEDQERYILAFLNEDRLRRVLGYMLDEKEFLSPHGIRSLSKVYEEQPYVFNLNGKTFSLSYDAGVSRTGLFGGNSNWRGPIWFPINYLIIEALREYYVHYGDEFTIAYPTGSDNMATLKEIANDLSRRLISLFLPDSEGRRPLHGDRHLFWEDAGWRDLLLFHEFFHGDNGEGLGASHQTGWTGLVANLLHET
jgi:hypothetical protein